MKTRTTLILVAAAGLVLLSGCSKKKHEEIDLSSIHTSTAETMSQGTDDPAKHPSKETEAIVISDQETSLVEESSKDAKPSSSSKDSSGSSSAFSVPTALETYQSGNISIQYPVVQKLEDSSKQNAINQLLKENALSIIKAYPVDEAKDTLDIKCKIENADLKRLTVTYTGYLNADQSAHPVSLFYANTVDMRQASNLGFTDYSDPYTMAGYVLSDDCQLFNATAEQAAEFRNIKNNMTLEEYTELFTKADFPLKDSTFPESFSYEKLGTIYFSIPVPHSLNDYVLVKYSPDTK